MRNFGVLSAFAISTGGGFTYYCYYFNLHWQCVQRSPWPAVADPGPPWHRCPREQGHYGFMLTDLYLLPLLSGQQADIHEGRLHLDPQFPAPYSLPVLLTGCMGTISAAVNVNGANVTYTLTVNFGQLHLFAVGGLVVSGSTYPGGVVHLGDGESISWSS